MYTYKKLDGITPMIEEFIGELNLPISIVYPLVNKSYQLRNKLINKQ